MDPDVDGGAILIHTHGQVEELVDVPDVVGLTVQPPGQPVQQPGDTAPHSTVTSPSRRTISSTAAPQALAYAETTSSGPAVSFQRTLMSMAAPFSSTPTLNPLTAAPTAHRPAPPEPAHRPGPTRRRTCSRHLLWGCGHQVVAHRAGLGDHLLGERVADRAARPEPESVVDQLGEGHAQQPLVDHRSSASR